MNLHPRAGILIGSLSDFIFGSHKHVFFFILR